MRARPRDERPAQVGVDGQALERPSRPAIVAQAVAVVGRGRRQRAARSASWWSLPGSAASTSSRTPCSQRAASAGRLSRSAVNRLTRRSALAQQRRHGGEVGLGADAGQHEGHEVGGRQLGVARHVPRRAPAQGAGQRVVERRDAARCRVVERPLVEADLGVRQVVVVEQDQVGLRLADQLGDLGATRRGRRSRSGRCARGGRPVRSYRPIAMRWRRSVGYSSIAVCSTANDVKPPASSTSKCGAQRVDARGLQPLRRPSRRARGPRRPRARPAGPCSSVLPYACLREVGAQTGEEVLLADPRDELLERRGALGVRDAVEVGLDRVQVVVVGRDRVRRGQLVLAVGPVLAVVGEARSRRR